MQSTVPPSTFVAAALLSIVATPGLCPAAAVRLATAPTPAISRDLADTNLYEWFITSEIPEKVKDPGEEPAPGSGADPATPDVSLDDGEPDGTGGGEADPVPLPEPGAPGQPMTTKEVYIESLLRKSKIQLSAGGLTASRETVNQLINLDPANPEAYVIRGVIDLHEERFGRAIGDFERALGIDPANTSALHSRALAFMKLGQTDRALDDFNNVIRLDRLFAEAYLKRGLIRAQRDAFEPALGDFTTYCELRPDDPVGFNNVAAALARLGRQEEAVAAFKKAQALERRAAAERR